MKAILAHLSRYIDPYWHLSYNDAEALFHGGLMSEKAWMVFTLFWDWSAPRHSVWAQERLRKRRGWPAVVRRINQFRAAQNLPLY